MHLTQHRSSWKTIISNPAPLVQHYFRINIFSWHWFYYSTSLMHTCHFCFHECNGKGEKPYLWLGSMPTSAWGADMLERWLENRLLPMAPVRYASCSLTTLGMLKESSRKKKQESRGNNCPKPHLHIYSCQELTGCQMCTWHLLNKTPSLQIWILPLDFTVTVQKDIKCCRMRNPAHMGQGFMYAFSLYSSWENMYGEFSFH